MYRYTDGIFGKNFKKEQIIFIINDIFERTLKLYPLNFNVNLYDMDEVLKCFEILDQIIYFYHNYLIFLKEKGSIYNPTYKNLLSFIFDNLTKKKS